MDRGVVIADFMMNGHSKSTTYSQRETAVKVDEAYIVQALSFMPPFCAVIKIEATFNFCVSTAIG